MSLGRKIIVCLLMIIIIGCNKIDGREPVLHRVGDFGFDKHIYNVLEVNKTSYEKCIDTGYINNITRGGRDVFQLSEERTYYFLCGRGFCFQGMKVEINVEPLELPLLLPPTIPNKAAADSSSRKMNYILLSRISHSITCSYHFVHMFYMFVFHCQIYMF
ncbi:unnamed protein product [Trifolium pratense]|uniref:Uncharacterized protein n=1 Tax=Trifolium pratense TaxID=57577 RepID=A0ACB0JEM4_TRIPR|nr:unnamed protein product [Trifolium pratense]